MRNPLLRRARSAPGRNGGSEGVVHDDAGRKEGEEEEEDWEPAWKCESMAIHLSGLLFTCNVEISCLEFLSCCCSTSRPAIDLPDASSLASFPLSRVQISRSPR